VDALLILMFGRRSDAAASAISTEPNQMITWSQG